MKLCVVVAKTHLSLLLKICIFIALAILTALVQKSIEKYTKIGDQLLQHNDFSKEMLGWKVDGAKTGSVVGEQGWMTLRQTAQGQSLQVSQSLTPALPVEVKVVLEASVSVDNISPGPNGWDKARIIFVQYKDGQPKYQYSHGLVTLAGTVGWKDYRQVFEIMPGSSEARVIIQMSQCTGEMRVKDLSLFQVVANPAYGVVKWLVMALWAMFVVFLFGPVIVEGWRGSGKGVLLLLTLAGIIIGTTMPGSLKNELKADIAIEAKTYSADLPGVVRGGIRNVLEKLKEDHLDIDISKVAHFGLFALLAGIMLWQNSRLIHECVFDGLMLACGSELAQLFVEGRSALVGDVGIDMAGFGIGVVVVWFCSRWRVSGKCGF